MSRTSTRPGPTRVSARKIVELVGSDVFGASGQPARDAKLRPIAHVLQQGLLGIGPLAKVRESFGGQQRLVRSVCAYLCVLQGALDHFAGPVVVKCQFQVFAAAEHSDDETPVVGRHGPWRFRSQVRKDSQIPLHGVFIHGFHSFNRPLSFRYASACLALRMNARPPNAVIHASAVNTGGTMSSSSARTSAHSAGDSRAPVEDVRRQGCVDQFFFVVGPRLFRCVGAACSQSGSVVRRVAAVVTRRVTYCPY